MYNLSLRQLKTIITIAECGRLIKAAEILSLTPPAITIQLRLAEEEIGLLLFDRTPSGLKLTNAGKEVVANSKKIFGELKDMNSKLEAVSLAKRGTVKIGIVSTAKYFAHHIIAKFLEQNIDISVIINVNSRETILNEMESYNLDMAIVGTVPVNLNITTKPFGEHPLILIASPKSKLSKAKSVEKNKLTNEKFLTREVGSGTFNTLQSFLEDLKIEHEPILTISGTNETIKQAVMADLGIAIISEHCCVNELKNGHLKKISVKGLPIIKQWFIAKEQNRNLSPAANLLYKYIMENGKDFIPKVKY